MNSSSSTHERACLAKQAQIEPKFRLKQAKLKQNTMFVNMKLDLIIHNIIQLYLYIYIYTYLKIYLLRLEIGWYKFVNRFI